MSVKNYYIKIKGKFQQLWAFKILRYAIIIHIFYFVFSVILCLGFFINQNDFLIFYKAAEIFKTDITKLYDLNNYMIQGQPWNFRYFPLSAMFFVPLTYLNFNSAYIVFTFYNLGLNILTCIMLYKVIRLVWKEKDNNKALYFISIYLMSVPHVFNYILGQINIQITIFILISLYIFLKYKEMKWDLIGGAILGLSILIKPITIFIVPFLSIICYIREDKKFVIHFKKSLIRMIGTLLPLSTNILVFIMYPTLIEGFLNANFSGSTPVIVNFSYSISKLITNFFIFYGIPFNQVFVLLIVALLIGGTGFIIFMLGDFGEKRVVYGYFFGIVIMLLVYFDSWGHHLLILIPVLIIILFDLDVNAELTLKIVKGNVIFICFFDLLFMGIWYLTEKFFPFNFAITISLMMVFYMISKYSLKPKERE